MPQHSLLVAAETEDGSSGHEVAEHDEVPAVNGSRLSPVVEGAAGNPVEMAGIARHEAEAMLNRRGGNDNIGIRARVNFLTRKNPEVVGSVEKGVCQRQNERVAVEREKTGNPDKSGK
jgi:hypothetical protein